MVKELIIVAAGVAMVGVIIAIIKYRNSVKKNGDEIERIFVDELTIGDIKMWFNDKLQSNAQKGVIFYPTEENIIKWKVKMPENKNVLIQIVYDENEDTISEYREIVFSTLNEKLQNLLESNGGTLVIEK